MVRCRAAPATGIIDHTDAIFILMRAVTRVLGCGQRPRAEAVLRARQSYHSDSRPGERERMTRRQNIEAALAGWRDAERRLDAQVGDREETMLEIATHRAEFQRLCAQDIVVSMETRRQTHAFAGKTAVG